MSEFPSVSISGLYKAAVLAVLYNAAAPHRMGFLKTEHAPEVMDIPQAEHVINERGHDLLVDVPFLRDLPWMVPPFLEFTYVYGRPLHLSLSGEIFNPARYDHHHGPNAADRAVSELRHTGEVCTDTIYAMHAARLQEEVRDVLQNHGQYTALVQAAGMGDHTAQLMALARKALGASA